MFIIIVIIIIIITMIVIIVTITSINMFIITTIKYLYYLLAAPAPVAGVRDAEERHRDAEEVPEVVREGLLCVCVCVCVCAGLDILYCYFVLCVMLYQLMSVDVCVVCLCLLLLFEKAWGLTQLNSFQTTLSPNPEKLHTRYSPTNKTHNCECALQMFSSSGAGGLTTVR